MGFWSALGSSMAGMGGSGALGSWDGGWSTYSSSQSRTKYAANKAYEMQRKAALEMPSLTRQGLERAGINPLLATSAFGNVDAGSPAFYDAPVGGSAVSFDGLKGLLGKEKKEVAKNEVEKGEETNDLIRAQKENIKEQTRGQVIDNDLKSTMAASSAMQAAAAVGGVGVLGYKAVKHFGKEVHAPVGFAAEAAKASAASAKAVKAAKVGSMIRSGIGMFLPFVVGEAFDAIRRGYDAHRHDNRKLERFVRQQFLGVH